MRIDRLLRLCETIAVLALSAIVVGCASERPQPEQAVVGPTLTLRGFASIPDTDVLRATLIENSNGSYSSGPPTRNVLFVEASGKAWWMLPDDDHLIREYFVRKPVPARYDDERPAVAVVALAMPLDGDNKVGDLYLLDPAGRRIQRIADQVREVHGVALSGTGIAVVYDRGGRYMLEHYDAASFAKVSGVSVEVPKLQ